MFPNTFNTITDTFMVIIIFSSSFLLLLSPPLSFLRTPWDIHAAWDLVSHNACPAEGQGRPKHWPLLSQVFSPPTPFLLCKFSPHPSILAPPLNFQDLFSPCNCTKEPTLEESDLPKFTQQVNNRTMIPSWSSNVFHPSPRFCIWQGNIASFLPASEKYFTML